MAKLVIISAPSGTGKSTIIKRLTAEHPEFNLHFSISATSRPPRGTEQHGVEYYFFSPEEFRSHIEAGDFLEWEMVYTDRYYGTLRSEVARIDVLGGCVILDVDCVGGVNIKRSYGDDALSLFIQPPSIEVLRQRLEGRGTDSPEVIAERLAKAEQELSYAEQFDYRIVNDDLDTCVAEVVRLVDSFLSSKA